MLFSPRGFSDLTGQPSGDGRRTCSRSCRVNIERTNKQNSSAARKQADSSNDTQHQHWMTEMHWDSSSSSSSNSAQLQRAFANPAKVVCILLLASTRTLFQTTIIKLSQCSVSNLTLSADGKRRKQRLCTPVQVLSLCINVSPACYNIIYVLYVSDQTVRRQQQQQQQQQGDQ